MKKLGVLFLAGVLTAVLLAGCGEATEAPTDPAPETKATETQAAEADTTVAPTETEVEFNTANNDTSEEVIDLETGANLRETPEPDTEDEGVIPDENEQPYDDDADLGVIPDENPAIDEGGEP